MDTSTMSMSTVFFASTTTPLYSSSWTPTSTSAYAGNCIFLVLLSLVFRLLYASHAVLERRWMARSLNARDIIVDGVSESKRNSEGGAAEAEAEKGKYKDEARAGGSGSGSNSISSAGSVEEEAAVQRQMLLLRASRAKKLAQPWRLSVDLPRACLATVIAGVGYLLMLAVMTFNVGYFASVLGGVFLGELFAGRFSLHVGH